MLQFLVEEQPDRLTCSSTMTTSGVLASPEDPKYTASACRFPANRIRTASQQLFVKVAFLRGFLRGFLRTLLARTMDTEQKE